MTTEIATFGAGCFWKPQEEFDKIKGVVKTTVGFMGGDVKNPSYEQVCTNETGHVEVTQIEFDTDQISYEELLEKFWEIHDPTQIDRQGPDIGSQYRTVIFYHTGEQKRIAENSLKKHQKDFEGKITTSIEPATDFYKAEEYHQKYNEKNKLF